MYHNLSQISDIRSPARAYQSAIPQANSGSALITRVNRSARETPEKRRAEMTLCTVTGPLGCWYVHLKFAGSIHHCACTSVVYSASARCESTLVAQTRRFLLRLVVEKDERVYRASAYFPGRTTPFPGECHSHLIYIIVYFISVI